MAWVKIPKENHPLFYERLPKDRRVQTLQMFGAAAAKANGHLFGGLFAHSFMVKLGPADYEAALTLDGATPFDPMGNGRVMSNTVLMPEWVMDDASEMSEWLQRAFNHVLTLAAKLQHANPSQRPAPSRTKIQTRPRSGKQSMSKRTQTAKRTPAPKGKPAPKRKPASKRKPAPTRTPGQKRSSASKGTPARTRKLGQKRKSV